MPDREEPSLKRPLCGVAAKRAECGSATAAVGRAATALHLWHSQGAMNRGLTHVRPLGKNAVRAGSPRSGRRVRNACGPYDKMRAFRSLEGREPDGNRLAACSTSVVSAISKNAVHCFSSNLPIITWIYAISHAVGGCLWYRCTCRRY